MPFDGIVFDFNGVLWWDTHLHTWAWKQFSARLRGAPLSDEELAVEVFGRTNRHTLEYLVGHPLTREEAEDLSEQKEQIYRQACLDLGAEFRLSPGAVQLLDFLAAHNIRRTVATASDKINLEFFVEYLDLRRWFDLAQIVYDDGVRPGKPQPDIYLQAACNLGLEPARCVVVEDSRAGIAAARAAGIGCLYALGPAPTHPALRHLPGVREAIENLGQLPRDELFLGRR